MTRVEGVIVFGLGDITSFALSFRRSRSFSSIRLRSPSVMIPASLFPSRTAVAPSLFGGYLQDHLFQVIGGYFHQGFLVMHIEVARLSGTVVFPGLRPDEISQNHLL